jgi:hypothetical protein
MAMQRIGVGVILAIAMTGIVVSVLAASLLTAYQSVPNTGAVKSVGVGVFWDNSCTSNVTFIDWGLLEPGATVNVTVYIQNKGNVPVVLNMITDNWDPDSASDYITLTWNREGYILNTKTPVVEAVLTLSILSNVSEVTSFSFDIIITGTEFTLP